MSGPDREQQIAEAEAILGDAHGEKGLAAGLFFGQFREEKHLAYPNLAEDVKGSELAAKLSTFLQEQVDPVEIDRRAEIPDQVIRGLGELGILGACVPERCGGLGLSQISYCRLLEVLGGYCGSTALFVNAHHSIGPRALVLFGSQEQQDQWLPKMATGEWISAFALTEPEAGSDAANVQTMATPTEDGKGYRLNGQKRWITNGGIAKALTVMARTPDPSGQSKITAFLVTPDMQGFEVVEKRMPKCGVRGTATSRLAFHDMFVPKENVLGPLGKGLKVALTVLDFGRTTFGASCTGSAKYCVQRTLEHITQRVQFQQKLAEFELVKEKLAYMRAGALAMEACTYQTAALIDSGAGDFMLETAMLKVYSTEVLWRIINDTFQLYGGLAYFNDQPFERMMRDARINTIGEGANDVLRAFVALVGMRDVGMELEGVLNAISRPFSHFGNISRFASRKISSLLVAPEVPVMHPELEDLAKKIGHAVGKLGGNVERLLRTYQREIVDRQYQLARISDAATELYVCSCVLNRLDHMMHWSHGPDAALEEDRHLSRYYITTALRRVHGWFRDLWDNDDKATTEIADRLLRRYS